MQKLEGRKAVVTGSGGAMGGAIALRLAAEGADVLLNDRVDDRTRGQEKAIRDLGRDVVCVTANVTRVEGAEEVFAAADEAWGRVDILVNVVGGIKGPVNNPVWEISEEEWEITIGINLRGTFHCTKLAAAGMMERRFGKILNIASIDWAGDGRRPHYAAAKAGVVAFTRSVSDQLAPYNVNVNAIAPGTTRRGMEIDRSARTTGAHPIGDAPSDPTPLGRTNEPEDIANAALFLVSEESRNISGQLLTVGAGLNPSL